MEPEKKRDNPAKAGWVLVIASCWLAYLPIFPGNVVSLLSAVMLIVALILAVVLLARGQLGHGIFLLITTLMAGSFLFRWSPLPGPGPSAADGPRPYLTMPDTRGLRGTSPTPTPAPNQITEQWGWQSRSRLNR